MDPQPQDLGGTGGPQPSLPKPPAGAGPLWSSIYPSRQGKRSAGPVVMMVMTDKSKACSVLPHHCLMQKVNHCPHLADGETQTQRSRGHTTSKGPTGPKPQSPTPPPPPQDWGGGREPIQDLGTPEVTKHLSVPLPPAGSLPGPRTLQETHC